MKTRLLAFLPLNIFLNSCLSLFVVSALIANGAFLFLCVSSKSEATSINPIQTISILEESLPALGDPDDRPQDPIQGDSDQNAQQDENTSFPDDSFLAHNNDNGENTAPPETPLSQEQELYKQAMHFISQQRPDLARVHLNDIIEKYPKSSESVLAHYWLGEMKTETGQFSEASIAYGKAYGTLRALKKSGSFQLTAFHGEEERLPEILYKLATSLKTIGKRKEACVTVMQIQRDFKNLPPTLSLLVHDLKSDLGCPKQ